MIPKISAILFVVCAATAVAKPKYVVTNLGTLPGTTSSAAYGINDLGQVVGSSDNRAFLYSGEVMTDLGVGGAPDINNSSQVIVNVTTLAPPNNGAFLYSGGVMTRLGSGLATAINDSGQAVGINGGAVIYSGGTANQFLFFTLGSAPTSANGINNSGQIVGTADYFAYRFSGGIRDQLGILPGWSSGGSTGMGINNSGQVVGYADTPSFGFHAFLFKGVPYSGGFMSDLGVGIAYAINDSGQVVGSNQVGQTTVDSFNRAFLYSNSERFDLNDVLVDGTGWTLKSAQAINNRG